MGDEDGLEGDASPRRRGTTDRIRGLESRINELTTRVNKGHALFMTRLLAEAGSLSEAPSPLELSNAQGTPNAVGIC